ncbi:MAG: NAD(P)/FAD-dependent oxidoreductase [Deltaproteobacteria bacterium]|nr:NAD(P)/FAD-dependent oxidoreductase [Deltaproteobacteria bacterium]
MNEQVKLLIVGSGPAGLSAAIQAARDGLDHLVLGRQPHGGLIHSARFIENLPGFPHGISGSRLAAIILAHALKLGVRLEAAEVRLCRRVGEDGYVAELEDGGQVHSRALIAATGTVPEDFDCRWSDGVHDSQRLHREARTLPRDLTGKVVTVVGGGEAALDTALNVADRGGTPRLVIRSEAFRARGRLVEAVQASCIEVLWKRTVRGLGPGDGMVIVCIEDEQGDFTRLHSHHVVICVGRKPCTEVLEGLPVGPADEVATHLPGLYLAGDLIRGRDRFVATALGDGQRAARLAGKFLNERESAPPLKLRRNIHGHYRRQEIIHSGHGGH